MRPFSCTIAQNTAHQRISKNKSTNFKNIELNALWDQIVFKYKRKIAFRSKSFPNYLQALTFAFGTALYLLFEFVQLVFGMVVVLNAGETLLLRSKGFPNHFASNSFERIYLSHKLYFHRHEIIF